MRRKQTGPTDAAARTALLDAAESLMQEEGYAAVTPRRVAARAGLRPRLVDDCFPAMDDLLVAVCRRRSERRLQLANLALKAEQPLHAIWELDNDSSGAVIDAEFVALANHRPMIRTEMAKAGEQLRAIEQEALARHFKARGVEPRIPPVAVSLFLSGIGRLMALEAEIGMSAAHEQTKAFVATCLRRFEEACAAGSPGP